MSKFITFELWMSPDEKKDISRIFQSKHKRKDYWYNQLVTGYFTLNPRSKAVLHFLRSKKVARHGEISKYLEKQGWAGLLRTSEPFEKLLVFGLIVREKRGLYAITGAGERLDLFRASYPVEYVNLDWLKHFLDYTW
ncbi:hypothetical protein DRO59_08610 [Candidatus Bathyarchaeota archaeon]|nr:MAG: hypothetical protein DRO59_08610 [Candidatus Bathyarchaeota archaeon]